MLQKTLDMLFRNKFNNLIVVDNASIDETDEIINFNKNRFDNFNLVRLSHNSGGAGGFERGLLSFLQIAEENDYALLHDDDSWPDFPCDFLMENLSRNHVKHGCFPVVYPDGELNQMNIPGNAALLRQPLPYLLSRKERANRRPRVMEDFKSVKDFDYASFVGYLIRKEEAMKIGVPSGEFFIYSDDTTYTYIASCKLGPIVNLYSNRMCFVHDCKRSTGRSLLTGRFANYEVRNKVIFLRIGSPNYHLMLSLFFLVKCLVLAPSKSRTILLSFFEGYRAQLNSYLPRGV
jgi:GT2 family glycosyltransferase